MESESAKSRAAPRVSPGLAGGGVRDIGGDDDDDSSTGGPTDSNALEAEADVEAVSGRGGGGGGGTDPTGVDDKCPVRTEVGLVGSDVVPVFDGGGGGGGGISGPGSVLFRSTSFASVIASSLAFRSSAISLS